MLYNKRTYNGLNGIRPDKLLYDHYFRMNERFIENIIKQDKDFALFRISGCIFGLAIGDVLGCPVEGLSSEKIKEKYNRIDSLVFPKYWNLWRLSGLHSDDTQQALVLLDAFIKNKIKFADRLNSQQEKSIINEIANLYKKGLIISSESKFGCWRGTGVGFRDVVTELQNKGSESSFGFGRSSAGIGAVMRIPPIGIIINNTELLERMVTLITLITHTDIDAVISAYAIASACMILSNMSDKNFKPYEFIHILYDRVNSFEINIQKIPEIKIYATDQVKYLTHNLSSMIKKLNEFINLDIKSAIDYIRNETKDLYNVETDPRRGFAPPSVILCLYLFLCNSNNPEKAILNAVNAGGDTDTIAAITGSLCGTLNGLESLYGLLPHIISLDYIYYKIKEWSEGDERVDHPIDLIEEEMHLTRLDDLYKDIMAKFYKK